MNAGRNSVIGVIFGGRSVEHDVSVVTGHQVMNACDQGPYTVVPIYIDRGGRWFTGAPLRDLKNFQGDISKMPGVTSIVLSPDIRQHGLIVNPLPDGIFARSQSLRLDVAFPTVHGSHGEDGTLQGLFELADIPYVGCGVLASAVANDKWLSKQVLRQAGIPVVDGMLVSRDRWDAAPDVCLAQITQELPFPVFIKPATLGSSIGIGRADDLPTLKAHLDMALNLDRRVVIERAITGGVEINCAIMGDERNLVTSVLEQPVSWDQFLTYEEKYLRGGEGMKSADRIIPAPLSEALTAHIQDLAKQAFTAIDGRGLARIDFLTYPERDEVYVNEINTLPGSLALYLWAETQMSTLDVIARLIDIAWHAQAEKRRNTYDYKTNLIALSAQRGVKGMKGVKSTRKPG